MIQTFRDMADDETKVRFESLLQKLITIYLKRNGKW